MTITLAEAAQALLDKLDVVADASSGVFVLAQVHGMPYQGPTWEPEYKALKATLSRVAGEAASPEPRASVFAPGGGVSIVADALREIKPEYGEDVLLAFGVHQMLARAMAVSVRGRRRSESHDTERQVWMASGDDHRAAGVERDPPDAAHRHW